MDFTVFQELTPFGHKTVGGFYNSVFAPAPLTTVMGLRDRVNPVGTEIASVGPVDARGGHTR